MDGGILALIILLTLAASSLYADRLEPAGASMGGLVPVKQQIFGTAECASSNCHNICDTNIILHLYACVKGACTDGGTTDCSLTAEVCLPPIVGDDSTCGGGGGGGE